MTIFNNSCIFYYIFLMPCCGILLRHFALYINLSQHRWADFFCFGLTTEPSVLRAGLCPGLLSVCPSGLQKRGWTSSRRPASSKSCFPDCRSDAFPCPGSSYPTVPAKFQCRWGEKFNCRASLPSSRTFCLETRIYLGYCSSAFSSGEHSLPFWDH